MYTYYQVNRAYNFLQCGGDGVDYSSIPQSYVVDLYLSRMRTATVEGSLDEAEEAKEALKTIAVSRGNPPELLQALDAKVEIDPQQAYNILEVASDLDEKTLVALYEIRVCIRSKRLRPSDELTDADHVPHTARPLTLTGFRSAGQVQRHEGSVAFDRRRPQQQLPSKLYPHGREE